MKKIRNVIDFFNSSKSSKTMKTNQSKIEEKEEEKEIIDKENSQKSKNTKRSFFPSMIKTPKKSITNKTSNHYSEKILSPSLTILDFEFFCSQNFRLRVFSEDEIQKSRLLGIGAYSHVYLAFDGSDDKNVKLFAMKCFKPKTNLNIIYNEVKIYRLLREISENSSESYFISLNCILKEKKAYSLILENGEGTMEEVINERKLRNMHYDEKEILVILLYLAKGLRALHHNNIIHHDIKPKNFIFTSSKQKDKYQFKYCDFGASSRLENSDHLIYNPIKTNFYAAPESLSSENPYDPYKYDIYTLGITVLEMMNFTRDEILQIKTHNDVNKMPCPMENMKCLWDIVIKMLAKDPKNRISASNLCEILENLKETQENLGDFQENDGILLHIKGSQGEFFEKGTFPSLFNHNIFLEINDECSYPLNINPFFTEINQVKKKKFLEKWSEIIYECEQLKAMISGFEYNFNRKFLINIYLSCNPFFVRSNDLEIVDETKKLAYMQMDPKIKALLEDLKTFYKENAILKQLCAFHFIMGIGKFHKINGNYDIALAFLEQAQIFSEQIFGRLSRSSTYIHLLLSQIYRALGEKTRVKFF